MVYNMAMKQKLIGLIGKIFARTSAIIKNDLDLKSLKRKYGADGTSIIQINVYEDRAYKRLIYSQMYRLGDDTIVVVDGEPNAITMVTYGTLINLVRGVVTRVAPNGERFTEPYDFLDAYGDGDVVIVRNNMSDDEKYLADIKLFQDLYRQVLPVVQKALGDRNA